MRLSTLWRPLALPLLLLALAVPARAQYNQAVTVPAGFLDISTIGTAVTAAEADDVLSAQFDFATVAPGFSFTYFGAAAPSFKVGSNGFMTLLATETNSGIANGLIPSAGVPNGTLAPFWDDLVNTGGSLGLPNAQVDYFHDAANGRFIVQWTNFRRFGTGTPGDLTFQVQLYASGVVEFHYATMADMGASYTVGVENTTGTIGMETFFNGASPFPVGPGAVRPNSAYRYTLATAPIAFVNATQFNFNASAGACSGFPRTLSVTFTNVGVGNLTVTGAAVTGSTAFGVGTPTLGAAPGTATTYPIVLAPGALANVVATYGPTAAQTGPQTSTITINTDGGTIPFPLSGSGSPQGAGYLYRSSLAPVGCETVGVSAPGTGFVPIAGHTRITTYTAGTADDGRFALALSTLGTAFPSFRLNGSDVTTLQILTNGLVSSSATASTTFYGANTTTSNTVQAAAMNLNMGVTGDAGGVGGEPGVYYGLNDVDADGDQDLVVTWWHAYDAASVAGATGQYLTFQLVVIRGDRPNEEATYEVRFPDGLDANGVAYRQNTTVADGAADVSIENDATTVVTEATGIESATYRFRNGTAGAGAIFSSAPLYATGGGPTAVRFQAEVQSVATGQAGWRLMGMPVRSQTVARLAGLNLVQAVTNQYPTGASPNLYTGFNGTAYTPAVSTTDALTPGRGFFWYLFNQNCDPTGATAPVCVAGSAPNATGTSRSYALPMKLQATGSEPAFQLQAYPLAITATGNGFNLVANPFRDDLIVSGVASWATGGTLASAVPQVWDPNVGSAGSFVNVSGSVSTWQGFFIQNRTDGTGASILTVPPTARNTAGTFLGRSGALYTNDSVEASTRAATVAFELTGADARTGGTTVDRAATLALDADGTDAWDVLDATKLAPLAAAYATVGFQGTGYDGSAAVKSQESRPVDAASFEVPLVVDAVGTAPSLTLSWAGLDDVPATWGLELRDVVTGQTVDLRAQPSYTFDQTAEAVTVTAPEALVARTTTGAQAKATASARFVLVVTTARTTAGEGEAITAFALAAPAPNPTAGAAVVSFDVPTASAVSVAVYDLLGRRVAVLAEGEMAAGRHTSRLEAGALAPGVYVVRMTAGTFSATRRVTVVR